MILIHKKIKKHNERKRLEAQDAVTANTNIDGTTVPESHSVGKSKEKNSISPEEVAEKKRRRTYRWKIILGLFAPFCLQSLDTTIIASALPYIAEDFGRRSHGQRDT